METIPSPKSYPSIREKLIEHKILCSSLATALFPNFLVAVTQLLDATERDSLFIPTTNTRSPSTTSSNELPKISHIMIIIV